jgi:hypothetical protein
VRREAIRRGTLHLALGPRHGGVSGGGRGTLRRIARAIEQSCDRWMASTRQLELIERVEDLASLLRSTIASDDASVQFSPLITGVTADPGVTLNELYNLYAGRYADPEPRPSRDDADVWRGFVGRLARPEILAHLRPWVLTSSHYAVFFEHAWQNGMCNVAQPISLDMIDPSRIRDKAISWTGRLLTVRPSAFDTRVFFLVGMPNDQRSKGIHDAAVDALAILSDKLAGEVQIVPEEREEELAQKLVSDIALHAASDVEDSTRS